MIPSSITCAKMQYKIGGYMAYKKTFKRKIYKTQAQKLACTEVFAPTIKAIIPDDIEPREDKKKKELEKEDRLKANISMWMAEWCTDFNQLAPEEYLEKGRGFSKGEIQDIFRLVPRHQWITKQGLFASEVVRRITVRGTERIAAEYDRDLKASQNTKTKLLDLLENGLRRQKTNSKGEVTKEWREPLSPSDYRSLSGAYETIQKIADRSLGITDNNREAILENIKAKEKDAKEITDESTKEVKKLTYEDVTDLVALRREARRADNEQKDSEDK